MASFTKAKTASNTGATSNPMVAANHQIEDAYSTSHAQAQAMRRNDRVVAMRPDGSTRTYTIDASRSDPARNLLYLLPV